MDNAFLQLALLGKNQWWRYTIGIIVIIISLQILGYIPTDLYLNTADKSQFTATEYYEYQDNLAFEKLGLSNNIGLLTLISGFALALIVQFIVYVFLHEKKAIHIITSSSHIRWKHILFGFAVWGLLMLFLSLGQVILFAENYTVQFNWSTFFPLLVISFLVLPIQTTFEEIFLRGYLFQAVGLWSKRGIIPVMVTSLFFMILHIGNPEVEAFGWYLMLPYYFGVAFTAALISLMDEGLEIALGIHAANNIIGALTITYSEAVIKTNAIWIAHTEDYNLGTISIYFFLFFLMIFSSYYFIKKEKSKASLHPST